MIRKLFIGFLILLLAVLLGLALRSTSGYLLIAYNHWTVEAPLWFSAFAIVILFILFHFILRFLLFLKNLPNQLHSWHSERHVKKAHSLTGQGLLALIEADWIAAEKWLLQGSTSSSIPVINYLGAATAAQERYAYKLRDEYLAKAHACVPEEEVAISLIQAQLQLNHDQLEQALATLKRLQQLSPKHPQVLKLLKDLYLKFEDWQNLFELLPRLQKQKVLELMELESLEVLIYSHLMQETKDFKHLEDLWDDVPRKLRENPELLKNYCQKLLEHDQNNTAIKLISDALNRNWNEDLAGLYGVAQGERPEKQLAAGEKWLKQQKHSPNLYLALARIALRFKYWAKAEEYLRSSLRIEEKPQIYALLGWIYQQTGNIPQALEYYRKGLQ